MDLSAADRDLLWVLLYEGSGPATSVARMRIPELDVETIEWKGGRLGAVASSSSGNESLVLELPHDLASNPALHEFTGSAWRQIRPRIRPDISSKLAWLQGSRIVYESSDRELVLLDLATGAEQHGPKGHFPAPARGAQEWYAIVGAQVARFPFDVPLSTTPDPLDGFDVRDPTSIRPTSDARVLAWSEPRAVKRSKGFVQERDRSRQRFRELDDGIGAVLGPSFYRASGAPAEAP